MDTILALFLGFLHPAATPPAAVPLPPSRPAVEAPAQAAPPAALSCAFHETADGGRRVIIARVSGPAGAKGTFAFTLHQRDAETKQADWPESATISVIGVWIGQNSLYKFIVDKYGHILSGNNLIGKVVSPCCGNFSFKHYLNNNDNEAYICNYWVSLSNKNDKSFFKLVNYHNENRCVSGLFFRYK